MNRVVKAKVDDEKIRQKAEARLKEARSASRVVGTEDELRRLLHELQVHQVELELQNEELNRANAEIEEARECYVDLYDFAPLGYFTLDREGLILGSNVPGAKLIGTDRSELPGKNFLSFFVSGSRQIIADNLETSFRERERRSCEASLLAEGANTLYVHLEIVPSKVSSECRVAVLDVTDRKLAENVRTELESRLRQSQKMEAIGTLAGGIAHDFNNLLGIIIGYLDLAIHDLPEDSPLRESIAGAFSASLRAKELVKQILAFGRKGEKKVVAMETHQLVSEAMKLLGTVIPKTITIELNLNRSAGYVLVDPTELHQVVMNLCTNAYQAMSLQESGILRVRLSAATFDPGERETPQGLPPGEYIRLDVEDNGPGMDEATKTRIFEPYFTTKGLGSGTGLGLALVHSIVVDAGGAIHVDSTPGIGTQVTVYLPKHIPPQPEIALMTVESPPKGRGRILFVDDNVDLALLGKKMLETIGYSVLQVSDPLEAMKIFENNPLEFDAIVTDQTMPGLTGYELLTRVHALRPEMPSILCTGYSDLIDETKAKKMGIDAYILKPYTTKILGAALATALAETRVHDSSPVF